MVYFSRHFSLIVIVVSTRGSRVETCAPFFSQVPYKITGVYCRPWTDPWTKSLTLSFIAKERYYFPTNNVLLVDGHITNIFSNPILTPYSQNFYPFITPIHSETPRKYQHPGIKYNTQKRTFKPYFYLIQTFFITLSHTRYGKNRITYAMI